MQRLILFILFLGCLFSLSAQVIEKTVAIAPVSYSRQTSNEADAIRLYNYILNSLLQTQRLEVVDRFQGQEEIVKEKTLNKGVDFVEGTVVAQGKQAGADYVLITHINSANAVALKTNENELVGYEGNLSLFSRVISVETGKVIASAIITPSGTSTLDDLNYDQGIAERTVNKLLGGSGSASTPESALQQSMAKIEPYIRKFIDEVFPLEMKIADIQEVQHRKKTVTEVFLLGGESLGLKVNDNLLIKEIVERVIAGKVYKDEVEIGRLKVIRFTEDLVVCKIIDQSKIVMEAFTDMSDALKVVYTPSKRLF